MVKRVLILTLAVVVVLSFSSVALAADSGNGAEIDEDGKLFLPEERNPAEEAQENPILVMGRK